ncbi:MAG TPA: ATP-sensitive inward rectifier potassium channel 10 [Cyanobacteria bacterium UBA12227]|nr:ATP-sensitive inward rectifier potassium channel 10 [Cyanobacteria bacterium UBA12227]HAX87657.1 ATP-sensitive inward rectifier potassium channel 10 [Cyanobacteria bacterium UBA11370]HBY80755.1 ATP-sensitive inward rectifier potassium channel 10 [Cyanobacteria bacterium UBA11148]
MDKRLRTIPKKRRLNQERRFQIIRKGSTHSHWHDPYHLLLTLDWPWFFGLIGVGYIIVNALFALLYLAAGDCIENARPGYFWDAFFFSVQTMASIGYGAMYPRLECTYTNILVTIEALTGLMGLTIATGLMFARFSRPTARVLFSRVAVIAPLNGIPTLMFRTANERHNQILEAQLGVSLVRNEVSLEGESIRRLYDLKLVRSQTRIFALTWTAMHQIDESSPLYGATPESLAEAETEIVITLTGLDETVSQTIHARHYYNLKEIVWNMRFVDILSRGRDGQRIIDYTHFHDVMPV